MIWTFDSTWTWIVTIKAWFMYPLILQLTNINHTSWRIPRSKCSSNMVLNDKAAPKSHAEEENLTNVKNILNFLTHFSKRRLMKCLTKFLLYKAGMTSTTLKCLKSTDEIPRCCSILLLHISWRSELNFLKIKVVSNVIR